MVEFKLFNYLGLLTLVVMLSTATRVVLLTIVEQVVLRLAITISANVPLLLVPARKAILVQDATKVRFLPRFELLGVRHDYLDSF